MRSWVSRRSRQHKSVTQTVQGRSGKSFNKTHDYGWGRDKNLPCPIWEVSKQMTPKFSNRYQGLKCRVCLIMENPSAKPMEINGELDLYNLVKDEMISSDREILLSVLLNGMNRVIGVENVAIGGLHFCAWIPRDILKSAVLANAASIVICHNHPSGVLKPSPQDLKMTDILVKAAEILGIKVLDHLIISHEGFRSIMNESKQKREESNHVL
jgi:DNA repair protein RadC